MMAARRPTAISCLPPPTMPRAPRSEPFEVSESDIAPVRRFELLYRDRLGLPLSAASADDRIAALLAPLGASSRGRLIAALSEIESVLAASPGDVPSSPSSFVLRSHRPGDLGSALGADQINAIAAQTGLPVDELLKGLSQYLPDVIDHLTPEGRLPNANELSGRL